MERKTMKKISILAVVLASAVWAGAQSTGLNHPVKTTTAIPLKNWDTMSDTWVATDGLDRRIATHEKVGPLRKGKQLAMFYFLWHGAHGQSGPHDISKVLAADPEAMKKPNSPLWGPWMNYHHWGEPLFGYYLSTDEWVYRKHAQMLSDAQVDVVIFDTSNRHTFKKSYMALCRAFTKVRKAGGKTPQIAFLAPFSPSPESITQIYNDLYRPGLYKDLWYHWEGKPLMMAMKEGLSAEVKDFFTFRKPVPGYRQKPSGPYQWSWLQDHPQNVFYSDKDPKEQMAVGVGQNCTPKRSLTAFSAQGTQGRSWHKEAKDTRPNAVAYGFNFMEQWDRALKVDPSLIFVTGWNEWIALRAPEFAGDGPVAFVDMYTQEYGRDLEPMKGGHEDAYYYQFVNYARKYKGARPAPTLGAARTMVLDDLSAWAKVTPSFRDDKGDVGHRNHPGWGKAGPYVNKTGRNDLVETKVAYDAKTIWFYARTLQPLSPHTDDHWMMLFINTDRTRATGWEGYNYVLNRRADNAESTVLEESKKGWNWQKKATVRRYIGEREVVIEIPCAALGLTGTLDFEFKWADNMAEDDNILAFTTNGDTAPNGRFNYLARAASGVPEH